MLTLPRLLLAGSLLAVSAAASAQVVLAPPRPPGLPPPPVLTLPAPGAPVVIGDHRRAYPPAPGLRRGHYKHRHHKHGRRHRR